MRAIRNLIFLVLAAAACLLVGWLLMDRQPQPQPSIPTIEQIQQLSALVTQRVQVADVLETTISGYTGNVRAVLLVNGDLLLSVDLSQARFQDVDQAGRTATLVLPGPKVLSPRLDQQRTRLFTLGEGGLWRIVPGSSAYTTVVNRAYQQAQQIVADSASDPALMDRSRRQAENILRTFFEAVGWELTLRWS